MRSLLDNYTDPKKLGGKKCEDCGILDGTPNFDSNARGDQFPAQVVPAKLFNKDLCQKCFNIEVVKLCAPELSMTEVEEIVLS